MIRIGKYDIVSVLLQSYECKLQNKQKISYYVRETHF